LDLRGTCPRPACGCSLLFEVRPPSWCPALKLFHLGPIIRAGQQSPTPQLPPSPGVFFVCGKAFSREGITQLTRSRLSMQIIKLGFTLPPALSVSSTTPSTRSLLHPTDDGIRSLGLRYSDLQRSSIFRRSRVRRSTIPAVDTILRRSASASFNTKWDL
jgi:hypothetical protein